MRWWLSYTWPYSIWQPINKCGLTTAGRKEDARLSFGALLNYLGKSITLYNVHSLWKWKMIFWFYRNSNGCPFSPDLCSPPNNSRLSRVTFSFSFFIKHIFITYSRRFSLSSLMPDWSKTLMLKLLTSICRSDRNDALIIQDTLMRQQSCLRQNAHIIEKTTVINYDEWFEEYTLVYRPLRYKRGWRWKQTFVQNSQNPFLKTKPHFRKNICILREKNLVRIIANKKSMHFSCKQFLICCVKPTSSCVVMNWLS